MEEEKYIALTRICTCYEVEPQFFEHLADFGLIEVISREEDRFIDREHLSELETLIRLHYELDINYAGLDAISHMLKRMREMQKEMNELRNKLNI